MNLTVITPYVSAHVDLLERARASVLAQTIPCDFIAIYDEFRQGVAQARNEGVKLAQTELVAFLDADDVLASDYAEKMMAAWQAGHYVYCDFLFGKHRELRQTKDCILWRQERRHTVSCVISKADFERVGGFDPTYRKAEDVEFWARCHAKGVSGIRVPYPLLHYTDDKPIKRYELQNEVGRYLQKIYQEYSGVTTMGCCGEQGATALKIPTGKQDGDVLVKVTWRGNRTFHGRVSGRDYPYNGNGKLAWIDPRDQKAEPASFVLVDAEPEQAAKKPDAPKESDASSVVIIESTGGVAQEWHGASETPAEEGADNFPIEEESALPLDEKSKKSRSK